MRRNVRIICTTGTSLLNKVPPISSEEKQRLIAAMDEQMLSFIQDIHKGEAPRENVFRLLREVPNMDEKKLAGVPHEFNRDYIFPTAETQTVIRWLADAKDNISQVHVILFPSKTDDAILTAHATCFCLSRLEKLFPEIKLHCDSDEIVPLTIKVDTREDLLNSISDLYQALDEQSQYAREEGEEVVLCATGGFKAISGFVMMYAQVNSVPCLYAFEQSTHAFEVMNVPLGYAYTALDEEINILKAIKDHVDLDISVFPRWVQDSKKLASSFLESYKRARDKPCGTGEALFERLRGYNEAGKKWANYLQSLLTHNWSQLWGGDQIPETVEHSRRHSKRLMEFTANLFRCAEKQLETLGFNADHPEMLAILIASIYLHDIGHTALSYPILDEMSGPVDIFPLGLFPSAVREVHHLLTGQLLRRDSARARYFTRSDNPDQDDKWMTDILMTCVPLVSEHHRGYTMLKDKEAEPREKIRLVGQLLLGAEKFNETLRPLEKRYGEVQENCLVNAEQMMNLAALMRIIDGCDVQADRVIGEDYLKYRNQRSDDEARVLKMQLDNLCEDYLSKELKEALDALGSSDDSYDKIYSLVFSELQKLKTDCKGSWNSVRKKAMPKFMALSLANRVAFKEEQRLHFSKHQNVGFVLPVLEENNTVKVEIFPNNDLPEPSRYILGKICGDINDEYGKVEDVLTDRLIFKAEIAGEI